MRALARPCAGPTAMVGSIRAYHPMKNGGFPKLGTKGNVAKRFRLTPRGLIKYWPSQLSGKPRFVMPTGNFKHLAQLLLPNTGNRSKWGQAKAKRPDLVDVLMTAKARFRSVKGRDLTAAEVAQLATTIKGARFVGNRVTLADGQQPLRFQ